jgi:hypothetical protein
MEPFNDPTVVAYVLLMPVIIIGLAKMWKRLKDKKAAAAATNQAAGGESS